MKMSKRHKGKPLAGVRILVGRARHQASVLSEQLKANGAEVVEIPFIEIRAPRSYQPLDSALKNIEQYDWLILTSVNGVDALATRVKRLRIRSAMFSHLRVAAIGPSTREAAEALGLSVAVVPERYVAESVVERLRGKVRGQRILLARAKIARDVIPRELRKAGARVDVVEAYETIVPAVSKKKIRELMTNSAKRPHTITFTSSSTVKNFFTLLCGQARNRRILVDGIKLASIGPITSSTLRECGLHIDIEATEYTIPGLVRAIVEGYRASG